MPRRGVILQLALAGLVAAVSLQGAILPDRLAGAMKSNAETVAPPDAALFEEYGFEGGEKGTFGPTTLTVWRFHDSTGAMAAYEYARPAAAKVVTSKVNKLAALTSTGAIYEYGNYVVQVTGRVPEEDEISQVYLALPKVEQSGLPVISTYLPPDGLLPNSDRYIMGPVSLQRFEPKVPPSLAAFHMSAEGQYARYRTAKGEIGLTIFSYPTPGIARERAAEFGKVADLITKRTGPWVVVASGASDADAAERLLAKVNYQASVTVNEKAPNHEVKSFARTILNYIAFAGLIIVFCVLSGLLFAAGRILKRRVASQGEQEEMITLHLGSK